VRINSVRLENFRQHADSTIRFDLGLTGVIGPNGSGKSTVLEAIAWALYGMPAARGSRDGIRSIRAAARSPVNVELDFELGGHRYRVLRGLNSAELYLDGGVVPIANSITSVTELLRRRLGMTREEFFNTYFTGQKELASMASMKAVERAQFLSRVLGYERLRSAQALIRQRKSEITAESSGLQQGMPDPDYVERTLAQASDRLTSAVRRADAAAGGRDGATRALEELLPRWNAAQRDRERLRQANASLDVARTAHEAAQRELNRIERDLLSVTSARAELELLHEQILPLEALRGRLADLDELARLDGRRRALIESQSSLAAELSALAERRTQLASAPALELEERTHVEKRMGELREAERQLQAAHAEWTQDKQEAETRIEQLQAQFRELREQREKLVELGEDGICPTCSRPLGTHFRSFLETLDEQMQDITVDGRYYRGRIEQLRQLPADVHAAEELRRSTHVALVEHERRLAQLGAEVQELGSVGQDMGIKEARLAEMIAELEFLPLEYDAVAHQEVRSAIERLVPVEGLTLRLSGMLEREPQLLQERDAAHARVAAMDVQVAQITADVEGMKHVEALYAALAAEFERHSALLRGAELEAVAAEGELSSARAAMAPAEHARDELARTQARLREFTLGRLLHEELDSSFSDIRRELNQQLRPEISEIASSYLSDLTDGRYSELELDDQYNIVVLEDGIPKPVISGGEEDLANLVLRLAISQMIAERAGQPFSLLVLDEVFGSLDEERRLSVVDLLRGLADRVPQVLLITHIESVPMLDRMIRVEVDLNRGTSFVREVGGPGGLAA
jgi:exonuclease SbcC